jgi:hypothetical protein
MSFDRVGAYVTGAVIVAGGILVARGPLARGIGRARSRATVTAQELTYQPESVMSADVYHRFRRRREALAEMRVALRAWAVAESAAMAKTGRPERYLLSYQPVLKLSQLGVVSLWGPGAWSTAHGYGITCWVYVQVDAVLWPLHEGYRDTISWHHPFGQPSCAGDRSVPWAKGDSVRSYLPEPPLQ